MADDEDAIYVDVVPRLDEAAADDAAKKLGDKFKDATKGIGESIKDATRGIGEYLDKDITGTIKDFGRNLRDEVRSGNFRDAADDINNSIKGSTDLVTGLGESLGLHLDGVGAISKTITDTLSDLGTGAETVVNKIRSGVETATDKIGSFKSGLEGFKSGDYAKGIADLNKAFEGVLPQSLIDHANGVADVFTNTHDTIRNTIKDTTDTALELRAALGLGELGSGFGGALAAGAGEVVLPAAVSYALLGPGGVSDRLGTAAFNRWGAPSLHQDMGVPVPEHALGGLPGPATAQPVMDTSSLPSFAPLDMPDDSRNPSNSPRSAPTPTFVSGATSTGTADVRAQEAVVSAGAATISAGSLSLGGLSLPTPQVIVNSSPGIPGASGGDAYSRAMSGLMGGDHRTLTGGKSWFSSGGLLPGSSPGYDNMLGAIGGSPIGLEGGEFVVNPQATQANLGLLQAINGGMMGFDGGGGPLDGTDVHQTPVGQKPSGVLGQSPGGVQGQSPGGIKGQLPQGVMSGPSQPLKTADQPNPPQTIIPQGQGQGFSISGGIIGGAEGAASQAAGIAADAFTFGAAGGAASGATQIAMQEANRAIEYGVKAGTTLAVEAPLDTFWLSDSGLSDPSHSWFGKLGLSMIGQTGGAIQNLAGQTQAPLTQGQGQQSPLGGKPQGPQSPSIHIENQYNNSDVDHENNNRSLVNQMNAYANY